MSAATAPFSRFEMMASMRYLRPRRKEAFISVIAIISFLGIMLGVATLIIVMAVMNGFRSELISKILGVNGHVILQPVDPKLTDYRDVAERIENVPGVVSAFPLVEGQALGAGAVGGGAGILLRGVRGADILRVPGVAGTLDGRGSLANFDSAGGVAIGEGLAQKLGLFVGDNLTIVSPQGSITPMGTVPRIKAYPVVAIFKIGMSEYDAAFVFMPLAEAQAYLNLDDEAQAIEIFIEDPEAVDEIRPLIDQAAARPSFTVSWRDRNSVFFGLLALERNVMFVILTLIVIVAVLNIVSSLVMLVKDKGRDIAILRTMGATKGAVMRIFIVTGSLIGVTGTLAGLALGTLICWQIAYVEDFVSWLTGSNPFKDGSYFINQLPARMDPYETMAIVLVSMVLSFLATIPPAYRAAKLDPVEALRYE